MVDVTTALVLQVGGAFFTAAGTIFLYHKRMLKEAAKKAGSEIQNAEQIKVIINDIAMLKQDKADRDLVDLRLQTISNQIDRSGELSNRQHEELSEKFNGMASQVNKMSGKMDAFIDFMKEKK